jgi:O-methyltransferase
MYRRNPRAASPRLLHALGIADPSYRTDFCTLARIVDSLPSFSDQVDVIECGVYRGSTLLGMAHRLAMRGLREVRLIGCDSFEGFPVPTSEDALADGSFHEQALKGVFGDTSYEGLLSRISALGYAENIEVCKGFFENTLPLLADKRYCLAHIDCDLYQSYVTCLEFLYPRMVGGGFMVFDEYDFSRSVYPGAQKAIDEFFQDRPEKLQRFSDLDCARCFVVKD